MIRRRCFLRPREGIASDRPTDAAARLAVAGRRLHEDARRGIGTTA